MHYGEALELRVFQTEPVVDPSTGLTEESIRLPIMHSTCSGCFLTRGLDISHFPCRVYGVLTETAIFPKMSSGIVWPLSITCL